MSIDYTNWVSWEMAGGLAARLLEKEFQEAVKNNSPLGVSAKKIGESWGMASNSERVQVTVKMGTPKDGYIQLGSFTLEEFPGCCAFSVLHYFHASYSKVGAYSPMGTMPTGLNKLLFKLASEMSRLAGYTQMFYLPVKGGGSEVYVNDLRSLGFEEVVKPFKAVRTGTQMMTFLRNVQEPFPGESLKVTKKEKVSA